MDTPPPAVKVVDTPPPVKKPARKRVAKAKKEPRMLYEEDFERVQNAMGEIELTSTQIKVATEMEATGDMRHGLLFEIGPAVDLSCLYACMSIVDKWKPKVDSTGKITAPQEGNIDSVDECDLAAVQLAALSFNVSMLKGQLDAAEGATADDLDFIEAGLRKKIRREKRKGLRGDPTEAELKDLVKTHETYREACNLHASCKELASVVTACYFAAKRLEDRLNNRVRSLTSHWGKNTHG